MEIMGFDRLVADRLQRSNRLECGLRVIDGDVPGLSRRWRHGRASLSPGRIVFERSLALGMRIRRPWTPPVTLATGSVHDGRSPTAKEIWSLDPSTEVLRVEAAGGAVVEWAVQGFQREWAIRTIT